MYEHILVGVAPDHGKKSAAAYDIAERLLKPGGKITALSVVETVPGYIAQQLPQGQMEHNIANLEASLGAGIAGHESVTPLVVVGYPAQALLDYAEEHQVDCIVIASHRPGLQDFFLGSTAARVVRHAQCSVHVLR